MKIDKFLIINHRGNITVRERTPSLKGNEIAVRLVLEVPNALFERPTLVAKMEIPEKAVPKSTITPTIATNIENIIKEATGLTMHVDIVEHTQEQPADTPLSASLLNL